MMDGNYFRSNRRSEIQELRDELQNAEKDRQKDAIKKIISAMTTGKDVSSLFPDVVNCIQTNNIELKKLVYLYIINYAKVQPELAILAVNTFCKDSRDRNPLIRALAIRTMGYIRLTQITEYLVEPLKQCYVDPDPYVRKTAAICIAKLYDISPSLVIEGGFLEMLEEMLLDSNPMVVANVVATMVEISEISDDNMFERLINKNEICLNALLNSLNQCIEWGQVYILDALSYYNPNNSNDAKRIIECVLSRFSHINSAVVMSAIKVVLNMMVKINDKEYLKLIHCKLSAPLVTLTSLEPEIQYVALRSILIIIQKYPKLLEDNIEKLDIMVRLVTYSNYILILNELREYAMDIDIEFVKYSIRSIGILCIRLELSLNTCMNVIIDLLKLKILHVTEECIIVLSYILRCYPNIFTIDIFKLCTDIECIYNVESKTSLIWIIGQYCNKIDDPYDYIMNLSENFNDEPHSVQLSLLTSAVKLYLYNGNDNIINNILYNYGINCNNPDVRDRSYIYLRLLNSGKDISSKVILSSLPKIIESSIDKNIIDDLLFNIGKVSSIYHLPSWALAFKNNTLDFIEDGEEGSDGSSIMGGGEGMDGSSIMGMMEDGSKDMLDVTSSGMKSSTGPRVEPVADLREAKGELIKRGTTPSGKTTSGGTPSGKDSRIVTSSGSGRSGDGTESSMSNKYNTFNEIFKSVYKTLLPSTQSGINGQLGLEIYGGLYRINDKISLEMKLINNTSVLFTLIAIQFNTNSFGLSPINSLNTPINIQPSKNSICHISLNPNIIPSNIPPTDPINIQVAIKTNIDIFYFNITCELPIVLKYDAELNLDQYKFHWNQFNNKIIPFNFNNIQRLIKRFKTLNIFHIANNLFNNNAYYFYAITTNSLAILIELYNEQANIKTESSALIPLVINTLKLVN